MSTGFVCSSSLSEKMKENKTNLAQLIFPYFNAHKTILPGRRGVPLKKRRGKNNAPLNAVSNQEEDTSFFKRGKTPNRWRSGYGATTICRSTQSVSSEPFVPGPSTESPELLSITSIRSR